MGEREVGRSNGRGRRVATLGALVALALVGTGAASGATTQQIYRDLADNNQLDGKYTAAELERAFDLPRVVGTDRTPAARKPIAVPATDDPVQPPVQRSERRVPFSALDAVLLVAGGGPLLLIGAGLRRRMNAAPAEAPAASA